MIDLPEDQLPDEQDAATVPVMGRGNVHPKFKWIAEGLVAVQKSQADLARALGWDQPTMSRQLKGKRQLKADELKDIHKFFEDSGLKTQREGSSPNRPLTMSRETSHTGTDDQAGLEGKGMLLDTIKDLGRLEDRLKAVEARLEALEQGTRGIKKGPR